MLSYKTQTPEVYMQKIRRNKGIEKTEVNCIIPFQMSKIRNAQEPWIITKSLHSIWYSGLITKFKNDKKAMNHNTRALKFEDFGMRDIE
jgi:hypothetical protein